jgi:hypothetical protein
MLLALFTSPDRASTIEGDLREEAQTHGRTWFWSHVIRTIGALCLKGFAQSPFATLALTVSGVVVFLLIYSLLLPEGLVIGPGWRGPAVALAEAVLDEPVGLPYGNMGPLSWSVGLLAAFLTGAFLARAAPVRGMCASVGVGFALPITHAIGLGLVMIQNGFVTQSVPEGFGLSEAMTLVATAVLVNSATAMPPLLLGGALARRWVAGKAQAVEGPLSDKRDLS